MVACDRGSSSNACVPFSDRELGITGSEYRPCAEEILAALDSIRPGLRAIVAGDEAAAGRTRSNYGSLREMIAQTGIADDYRSMESSTVIVKWPDASLRAFNSSVFTATVQYGAVLAYPNEDNLRQGERAHEEARRAFGGMR